MTVESTSGGDPEDPDSAEGRRPLEAGDNLDLAGVRNPRAVGDDLHAEIERGDNNLTRNSTAWEGVWGLPQWSPTSSRIPLRIEDPTTPTTMTAPTTTMASRKPLEAGLADGIALIADPNPGDNVLIGHRIGLVHGRPIARQPCIPLPRQLHIPGVLGFRQ